MCSKAMSVNKDKKNMTEKNKGIKNIMIIWILKEKSYFLKIKHNNIVQQSYAGKKKARHEAQQYSYNNMDTERKKAYLENRTQQHLSMDPAQ